MAAVRHLVYFVSFFGAPPTDYTNECWFGMEQLDSSFTALCDPTANARVTCGEDPARAPSRRAA